jgi:seryl-tRNA synthetase
VRSSLVVVVVVVAVVVSMLVVTLGLLQTAVTKQQHRGGGGLGHVVAAAVTTAFHHHHPKAALRIPPASPQLVRASSSARTTTTTTTMKLFSTTTKTTTTTSSSEESSSSLSTISSQEQPEKEPSKTEPQRLSSKDLILDLRCFQGEENLNVVLSHLHARRASKETIQSAHEIVALAERRVALIQQRDAFLNQRKTASATVGQCNRQLSDAKTTLSPEQRTEIQSHLDASKAASTQAADGANRAEDELNGIQTTLDALLAGIPNLLDDVVPDGKDDGDNQVVSTWGNVHTLPQRLGWFQDDNNGDDDDDDANDSDADEQQQQQQQNKSNKNNNNKYKFVPAWHDDVAAGLQGYRAEQAVSMSGTRFVALSGVVAQLERALASFFMDLHTTQHGYTEVSVPLIVSRQALQGTSQLPKFEADLFAIAPQSHTCNGQDAFLIPTAEVPVTNLHAGQMLDETLDKLPISYVSCTPCFRAEAGSYGRDTKGLIRTHQFLKVELVKITTPETSDAQHELLTSHAEACLQALELPYRKVRLCSGDTGFAARHCYDLEVWLPGACEYREISSCSNCGDFQARRMMLRYRPAAATTTTTTTTDSISNDSGKKKTKTENNKVKPVYCHTINGSGLAVGRALVAVLENYQTPDGSVVVPKVLQPYMGGKEILMAAVAVPSSSSSPS